MLYIDKATSTRWQIQGKPFVSLSACHVHPVPSLGHPGQPGMQLFKPQTQLLRVANSKQRSPFLSKRHQQPCPRQLVQTRVQLDNRELLIGDCLSLTSFCLYKQVQHPNPSCSTPQSFLLHVAMFCQGNDTGPTAFYSFLHTCNDGV